MLDSESKRKLDDQARIQEERYKTLVENLPCAVYSAFPGQTGPTTFISNKWKDWTGYSPEELYQDPEAWPKCIHSDDREKAVNTYSGACKDEAPYNLEYRIIHKDTGQVRYVRDQGLLSKDEKGAIIRVDGIVTDITELKEAENELKKHQDHLEELVKERAAELSRAYEALKLEDTERRRMENLVSIERDLAVELGNTTGLQEGLRICLEAAMKASGMDCGGVYLFDETSRILELAYHEGLSPDFVKSVSHYDENSPNLQLVIKGKPVYTEYKELGVPLDGNERHGGLKSIAVVPMIDKGQVVGCLNVASHSLETFPAWSRAALETVTAEIGSMIRRLKAEEKLRHSEERFRSFAENAPDFVMQIGHDGTIQFINRTLEGLSQEDVVGSSVFSWLPEDYIPTFKRALSQVSETAQAQIVEHPAWNEQKEMRWYSSHLGPIGERGNVVRAIVIARDITERKQAEDMLRMSELRIRSLIEQTTDAVFCYEYDPPIPTDLPIEEQLKLLYDGVLVECNDVCAKSYGAQRAQEVIGGKLTELFGTAPESLDKLFTELIEGGYRIVDGQGIEKLEDGTERHYLNNGHGVIEDGKLLRVWGTFRNITEQKQAEEALAASETKYRSLFDNSIEGIDLSKGNRVISANKALLDVFGYDSLEEFVKIPLLDHVAPESREMVRELMAKREKGVLEPSSRFEHKIVRKDGQIRDLEISRAAVLIEGEDYTQSTFRDITERKRAEEELRESKERLSAIVEKSPIPTAVGGSDGSIMSFNKALEELTGYGRTEINDVTDWTNKLYPDQEYRDFVWKNIQQALRGEKQDCTEFTITRKDGSIKTVDFHTSFYKDGLIIQMVDITERKQAGAALQESENKFRSITENAVDFIFIKDMARRYTFANQAMQEMLGLCEEEILGKTQEEIFGSAEGHIIKEVDDRTFSGETVNETRSLVIGGKELFFNTSQTPLTMEDGEVTSIMGIVRDVTERKKSERELEESEKNYRSLFEGGPDGIIIADMDTGEYIHVNPAICQKLGYTEDEIKAVSQFRGIHPKEETERIKHLFYMQAKGEISIAEDIPFVKKDGTICYFDVNSVHVEFNGMRRVVGLLRDITERKKADHALRESEERLKILFESAPDAYYIHDLEGKFVDGNRVAEELLDYQREEVIGTSYFELGMVAEEDVPKSSAALADNRNGKPAGPLELTLNRKDGSKVTVETRSYPVEIGGETLILGIARDITERKQAEDALRESEELNRKLLVHAGDAVFLFGMDGRFVHVNEQACKSLGYSRDELLALCVWDVEVGWKRKDLEELFQSLLASPPVTHEGTQLRKDGTTFPVEVRIGPSRLKGHDHMLILARDITERKKAEEAVLEERDKAQKYLDVAAVMFVALDGQGNVTLVNKKGCELLGWDEPEVVGKNWFDNFLPEDIKEQVKAVLPELIAGHIEPVEYYENPILCKDGSQKIIAWHNTVLDDGSGNIIGVLSSGQDISERKQAEETLRSERDKLQTLMGGLALTGIGIDVVNIDYRVLFQNQTLIERFGDLTGKLCYEKYMGLKKPCDFCTMTKAIRNMKVESVELTAIDGRSYELLSAPLANPDGTVDKVIEVVKDTTERKQAEKKLLDHQAQLKSLASELSLTEERERHRLATELHDQIGQSLVISKIKLDLLRNSSVSDELTRALDEVCNYLGQVIDDTRTLTFDLSSPILYELGFEAAVSEWLDDEIQKKYGIETEFEDDGRQKPLDEDIRTLLFRNVRELLVNIVKHAQAHKVKVSVRRVDGHIHVSVEDDGMGFDPVKVKSTAAQKAQFGLFSIRERLEQLGGLIEIESEPGSGSKIIMTAPLKHDNNNNGAKT